VSREGSTKKKGPRGRGKGKGRGASQGAGPWKPREERGPAREKEDKGGVGEKRTQSVGGGKKTVSRSRCRMKGGAIIKKKAGVGPRRQSRREKSGREERRLPSTSPGTNGRGSREVGHGEKRPTERPRRRRKSVKWDGSFLPW